MIFHFLIQEFIKMVNSKKVCTNISDISKKNLSSLYRFVVSVQKTWDLEDEKKNCSVVLVFCHKILELSFLYKEHKTITKGMQKRWRLWNVES